jgi:predicted nicotinamide N-methyase
MSWVIEATDTNGVLARIRGTFKITGSVASSYIAPSASLLADPAGSAQAVSNALAAALQAETTRAQQAEAAANSTGATHTAQIADINGRTNVWNSALTNAGAFINGNAISNGANITLSGGSGTTFAEVSNVVRAIAFTNGGATINGNLITNGAAITITGSGGPSYLETTNIAAAAVAGYSNAVSNAVAKAGTAWQNPSSATNWTWTSDGTQITLTGYSGPNAVVIPDMLDGLPVTGFGTIFRADPITSISGGNNVTTIGISAFDSCTALTSVSLPSAATIGGSAFINCTALTSVSLPNATTIGSLAFINCTALTSVSLPNATTIGGSAFSVCTALASVSLPNATTIGAQVFYGCPVLTSVYFGQNAPAEAAYVYTDTPNATNYVTNPQATGWGTNWNGRPVVRMPVYADEYWRRGTNLTDLLSAKQDTIAGTVVTNGGSGASLTGITAAQVGAVASNDARYLASVTNAGAFINGNAISNGANITLSGGSGTTFSEVSNVVRAIAFTNGGATINGNLVTNGAAITITGSGGPSYLETTNIAAAAVAGYSNAVSNAVAKAGTAWQNPVSATNWTWTSDGTNITLTGYTGPAAVVIPDTLDGLPVTGFGSVFQYNGSITNVSGGANVTALGDAAFGECIHLTSVSLPNVTTIGENAFSYCASLASISVPNVVTVGRDAFLACDNLASISLPNATTINLEAFNSCDVLTSVYFGQNAPAEAADVYTLAPNVTNYVTNPQATGWTNVWNGRPVVRMPVYADEYWRRGTNLTDLLSAKQDTIAGTVVTNGGSGASLTGITAAQVGAPSNNAAGISLACGFTNLQPLAVSQLPDVVLTNGGSGTITALNVAGNLTLKTNGTYNGAIVFENPAALVTGAIWQISSIAVPTNALNHDNALCITYNARWNQGAPGSGIGAEEKWERITNDHCVQMGIESRYDETFQPLTTRGNVEWHIDVDASTNGPLVWKRPLFFAYSMGGASGNRQAFMRLGDWAYDQGIGARFEVLGSAEFYGATNNRPSLQVRQYTGQTQPLMRGLDSTDAVVFTVSTSGVVTANGSGLTGITAAQVGAVSNNATGIAAAGGLTGGVFSVGTSVSNLNGTLYIPTNLLQGATGPQGPAGTNGADGASGITNAVVTRIVTYSTTNPVITLAEGTNAWNWTPPTNVALNCTFSGPGAGYAGSGMLRLVRTNNDNSVSWPTNAVWFVNGTRTTNAPTLLNYNRIVVDCFDNMWTLGLVSTNSTSL